MSKLVITNGLSGIECLKQAGIEDALISWDDVLHDGPVPGGYPLYVLSELRARFIASVGWGDFEEIHAGFKQRDKMLRGAYDEVVLFFEHDLYDQLQLMQLLALHAEEPLSEVLSIAYPSTYIGHSDPEALMQCYAGRKQVSEQGVIAGTRAWRAFTAESPEGIVQELCYETPELPHLRDALFRLSEEYPDVVTELSGTEYRMLEVLADSAVQLRALFRAVQQNEAAVFMGDSSFLRYFESICEGATPLAQFAQNGHMAGGGEAAAWKRTVSITPAGLDVLKGRVPKSAYVEIDRWIGGTHINVSNPWRWDGSQQAFIR